MKSMCEIAALIVLLSITAVTTAFADGSNSVTVTNSTSLTMTQLYASPSSASAWNTNTNLLAGGLTLLPGAQVTVPIAGGGGGDDSCNYDLMGVLYGAAQYAYAYSVNACDGGSWTIH